MREAATAPEPESELTRSAGVSLPDEPACDELAFRLGGPGTFGLATHCDPIPAALPDGGGGTTPGAGQVGAGGIGGLCNRIRADAAGGTCGWARFSRGAGLGWHTADKFSGAVGTKSCISDNHTRLLSSDKSGGGGQLSAISC